MRPCGTFNLLICRRRGPCSLSPVRDISEKNTHTILTAQNRFQPEWELCFCPAADYSSVFRCADSSGQNGTGSSQCKARKQSSEAWGCVLTERKILSCVIKNERGRNGLHCGGQCHIVFCAIPIKPLCQSVKKRNLNGLKVLWEKKVDNRV